MHYWGVDCATVPVLLSTSTGLSSVSALILRIRGRKATLQGSLFSREPAHRFPRVSYTSSRREDRTQTNILHYIYYITHIHGT